MAFMCTMNLPVSGSVARRTDSAWTRAAGAPHILPRPLVSLATVVGAVWVASCATPRGRGDAERDSQAEADTAALDEVLAPPAGSLRISWSIAKSTCDLSGLTTVEVAVSTASGPVDARSVACAIGVVTFDSLPAGVYRVDLDGYSPEDPVAQFEAAIASVTVADGVETDASDAVLSPRPGALDVYWRFQDGDLCFSHGIEIVELTVFDKAANVVVEEKLPCDLSKLPVKPEPAEGIPDTSATVEPKGYLVSGLTAGEHLVQLRARASQDAEVTFWASATAEVHRGKVSELLTFLAGCNTEEAN